MDYNVEGKRLLLLGGVRPACEIVKAAKEMGVTTLVADYLEDSPAKKIADEQYLINAMSVDEVCSLCKEKKVDGIITGYVDSLLPFYQKDCEALNMACWGTEENIRMCISKDLFKEACERSGVPVVPWKKANRDNYLDQLEDIPLPAVIKPVVNSGSRGVFRCSDAAELQETVERSLSYSKTGEVLIEKAMDPHNEFSVYYILNHGECYLTGMGDRYVQIIDENIAPQGQGMYFPSVKLEQWIAQVDPVIRRFFAGNEMNDGFVFVQGFLEDERFYIHEIGYRLNGGYSFKIVEHFSDYHQVKELIRFALTGSMDVNEIRKSDPFFRGHGMIVTASLRPGTIGEVRGVKEIAGLPGVLECCQLHEPGENLTSKGTTAQVFAYILCAAESKEELRETIERIKSLLVVKDVDGTDLLNALVDPARIIMMGEK